MRKKIRAEKGGRGIESNVIEEYTPLQFGCEILQNTEKKPCKFCLLLYYERTLVTKLINYKFPHVIKCRQIFQLCKVIIPVLYKILKLNFVFF